MSEQCSSVVMRERIDSATVDLSEGPVGFWLGNQLFYVVDPKRDLGRKYFDQNELIVDPNEFDPSQFRGYMFISSDKRVLGTGQPADQLRFSPEVSEAHATINRVREHGLVIHDLQSPNGTYLDTSNRRKPTGKPPLRIYKTAHSARSIASLSHPGRNEDAVFANETSLSFGVFDGLGGVPGSEEASQKAKSVTQEITNNIPGDLPEPLGKLAVKLSLLSAHQGIVNTYPLNRIATTAAVTKIFQPINGDPYAAIAHTGDSRVYLYRNGVLKCLTIDHAKGISGRNHKESQEFLANVDNSYTLNEDELEAFNNRHVTYGYLGLASVRPTISVTDIELQNGDILLATSDGITDNLTDLEIQEVLAKKILVAEATSLLVDSATERSKDVGHLRAKVDDMSLVLFRFFLR